MRAEALKPSQQRAAHQANQTSNQTFSGSLVPWPRLPRFANFPFHFPFRGEKGSAPLKNGLEQFQRHSKQHLRRRLHFNGGPLGISDQNPPKKYPIVTRVGPPWIPLDPEQVPFKSIGIPHGSHLIPGRIPSKSMRIPHGSHMDPTWIPPPTLKIFIGFPMQNVRIGTP